MQKSVHRHFILTISGLFIVLATLAGIGLVNSNKVAAQLYKDNSFSEKETIRRLLTEITIQRLELNSSFDHYLQACLNKIRITKPDDFDTKNANQFLLYDLELQHRFHEEIKSTISNNFKSGKRAELLTEQLLRSEQDVEYFEKNLLLDKGLFNDQHADKLMQMIKEIRQKKVSLQQKLRALLTGVKYTEFDQDQPKKSSHSALLIFMMTLLTGIGFGIIFSYTYFKNNYFSSHTPLQLTGQVIKIIEGKSHPTPQKTE